MANVYSPSPATSNRARAVLEILRLAEWGLVVGIVAVLGVIYFLD